MPGIVERVRHVIVNFEYDDGSINVVSRHHSIGEAEGAIADLARAHPADVNAGRYTIDAPEEMLNEYQRKGHG